MSNLNYIFESDESKLSRESSFSSLFFICTNQKIFISSFLEPLSEPSSVGTDIYILFLLLSRSIANTHGRWGISNTRVPTESRPGHVAVIAGFYEDPSAIAKGWKANPVDFDSVFNQTRFTWCWGTYDIVEIFTKGSIDDHIDIETFDPYDQTFSTDKNTTLLDNWVFDKVKQFFKRAQHNDMLRNKLHQNKIAFFLHLLGTDTSGHTHKPKTQ